MIIAAAALAAADTAIHIATLIKLRFTPGHPRVVAWLASQYWVNYTSGFLRRGLPGQALQILAGSPTPASAVAAAATAMAALAITAIIVLAILASRTANPGWRTIAAAIIIVSPFTLTLAARDFGRYDAVGVAALTAVTGLGRWSSRPTAVIVLAAAAGAAAVGCEEFLIVFVSPVVFLAVYRVTGRVFPAATALAPAMALAAASLAAAPDPQVLRGLAVIAHTARPDIPADGHDTALAALTEDLGGALQHIGDLSPWTLPALTCILGGCYLAAGFVLRAAFGAPARFSAWCGFYAACAVGLSLIGIDYLRWWGMAFTALTATSLLLTQTRPPQPVTTRSATIVIVVLAALWVTQPMSVEASAYDRNAATHLTINP